MLKLMGEFLMVLIQLASGSGLNRYLVANLFKVNSKKDGKKKADLIENSIARRKPAKFNVCNFLYRWNDSIDERRFAIAEERISREIDIVSFLRHQMIDDVARRLLFTRMERYLIRN